MIDLRGEQPKKPASFDTDKAIKAAASKIEDIVDDHFPTSEDFDTAWLKYRHHFAKAQGDGKCAYCETHISSGFKGNVEHYRPKASVTVTILGQRNDLADKPPKKKVKAISYLGYWWLAYDWENWLLSCERCNNWKGCRFPVKKRLPLTPGVEKKEDPLLLNPFNDDPASHLRFDEMGGIYGVGRKGEVTVDVCGLDRLNLVNARKRIGQNVRKLIEEYALAEAECNDMAA